MSLDLEDRPAVSIDGGSDSQAPSRMLSDEHKAALAAGRIQSRAVKAYLDALKKNKPKRGRKRTLESVKSSLEEATKKLEEGITDPIEELLTTQLVTDLERELTVLEQSDASNIETLERDFVLHLRPYAISKGLTYETLRKVGVSTEVLKRAGLEPKNSHLRS